MYENVRSRVRVCKGLSDEFEVKFEEARWPSDRASDSGARGRVFDPHSGRRVVSLSKIHLPPKSTGNTQEAVAPSRYG